MVKVSAKMGHLTLRLKIEFDINRWGLGNVFQAEKQQEPEPGTWKEEGSEEAGVLGSKVVTANKRGKEETGRAEAGVLGS